MLCSRCSEPIKPIVAIDLDGTLGDYHTHLHAFLQNYFGKSLPSAWNGEPPNWEDYLGLTHEEYREGKLAFRQGGLKRWMPCFPSAMQFTNNCHLEGAEVWITTTRPWQRLDSVDPDTRFWLDRHHIFYDHLLYDEHKYPLLSTLVDPHRVCYILDDLVEQYAEAVMVYGWDVPVLAAGQHNSTFDAYKKKSKNLIEAWTLARESIKEWKEHHDG